MIIASGEILHRDAEKAANSFVRNMPSLEFSRRHGVFRALTEKWMRELWDFELRVPVENSCRNQRPNAWPLSEAVSAA